MAIEQDLKIFISWSGVLAKEVTKALRAWLPKMFDHIDPWASDVDIDAGLRGLDEIQGRLNESAFGIIVVTTENMEKSWLNFEAGALSKRLEGDANRVVPLLVNFDSVYQVQGPIRQFQATMLNQEGMQRLCRSIANVIGLDPLMIDSRFEWAWPSLESAIQDAKQIAGTQPTPPELNDTDLIKGLVRSVEGLERQMSNLAQSAPPILTSTGVKTFWVNDPNPWIDGHAMQILQDRVEAAANGIKPVRYVNPMERNNKKFIGVMFNDGEGLSQNEMKRFRSMFADYPVTVGVITDREINSV
ncbi:toll/interleukin-1 receptor domain-containing protein [Mycolicibacterium sp. J2]|uniref:toll/interleukin-1 receptor domain-containing protein n=1 Tax=Mycolicibacterium sp. J2 TaxID=2993511 RepID=UPI00224B7CCA|nr:toll/interleukin-1 receptor domain-containing protein [Mycolicibacterium sp. J2]MCX2716089.1 toll/interleukin-1 receptor domain-containing protein [Mycolicibacterium sp. J2]